MGVFLKDPAAVLDYAVEWSPAYLASAAVTSSDWIIDPVEPAGITAAATLMSSTRTGAVLGGGVPGHVYRVVNRVRLSDGRLDERTIALRVEDR